MYKYSKDNRNIIHKDVIKEDVFLPDIYLHDISFSIHGFLFSLPNSRSMQNLSPPIKTQRCLGFREKRL